MPIIIRQEDTELPRDLIFPEGPIDTGERAEYCKEYDEEAPVIDPELAGMHPVSLLVLRGSIREDLPIERRGKAFSSIKEAGEVIIYRTKMEL